MSAAGNDMPPPMSIPQQAIKVEDLPDDKKLTGLNIMSEKSKPSELTKQSGSQRLPAVSQLKVFGSGAPVVGVPSGLSNYMDEEEKVP